MSWASQSFLRRSYSPSRTLASDFQLLRPASVLRVFERAASSSEVSCRSSSCASRSPALTRAPTSEFSLATMPSRWASRSSWCSTIRGPETVKDFSVGGGSGAGAVAEGAGAVAAETRSGVCEEQPVNRSKAHPREIATRMRNFDRRMFRLQTMTTVANTARLEGCGKVHIRRDTNLRALCRVPPCQRELLHLDLQWPRERRTRANWPAERPWG